MRFLPCRSLFCWASLVLNTHHQDTGPFLGVEVMQRAQVLVQAKRGVKNVSLGGKGKGSMCRLQAGQRGGGVTYVSAGSLKKGDGSAIKRAGSK